MAAADQSRRTPRRATAARSAEDREPRSAQTSAVTTGPVRTCAAVMSATTSPAATSGARAKNAPVVPGVGAVAVGAVVPPRSRDAGRLRRARRRRARAMRREPRAPRPAWRGRSQLAGTERSEAARRPRIGDTRPAPAGEGGAPNLLGGPVRAKASVVAGVDLVGNPARARPRSQRCRIVQLPAHAHRADGRLRARRGRRADPEAASGQRAQGSARRPLPDGGPRQPQGDPHRRARGPQPGRALRVSALRRRHPDPRQHLSGPGPERAARHGGGLRRHRYPQECGALQG